MFFALNFLHKSRSKIDWICFAFENCVESLEFRLLSPGAGSSLAVPWQFPGSSLEVSFAVQVEVHYLQTALQRNPL